MTGNAHGKDRLTVLSVSSGGRVVLSRREALAQDALRILAFTEVVNGALATLATLALYVYEAHLTGARRGGAGARAGGPAM